MAILHQPGDTSEAYKVARTETADAVKCTSPITSGLPRSWDEIEVGHMVLAPEGGYGEGYWETVVVSKTNDILTLRYRDEPKLPQFQRHVLTVALVNPGPLPDKP